MCGSAFPRSTYARRESYGWSILAMRGIDRFNRPYVVTAAIGRQVPDRNDVMALERPKAEMTVHGGASVVLTAATGIYQSQAQLLDLFADVNLIHENGTRFVTQRAHLNVSANSAEGHDPVKATGLRATSPGKAFGSCRKVKPSSLLGNPIFSSREPNRAVLGPSLRHFPPRLRARPPGSKLRSPAPRSPCRRPILAVRPGDTNSRRAGRNSSRSREAPAKCQTWAQKPGARQTGPTKVAHAR